MAIIFPNILPGDLEKSASSSAEVHLFDKFKKFLPHEFTVFYNRCWVFKNSEGKLEQGEADFILCHPEFGILVLEVKGGRVSIDDRNGKFYSIDRNEKRHEIKDPWGQANRSQFVLLNKIRSYPLWKDRWIDIGHCVAFPDIYRNPEFQAGLNRPMETILFKDDLGEEKLPGKIRSIYEFWSKKKSLGRDGVELLIKFLAPVLEIKNPLKKELEAGEREMLRLREEQVRILDSLKDNQRLLVQGGAGTGKTVVLLEKAKQFAAENLETLIVCHSPVLASFLKSHLETEPITVLSFLDLLDLYCKETDTPNPFAGRNPFTLSGTERKEMADILWGCLDRSNTRFDAILVDEGQDFTQEWWDVLEILFHEKDYKFFYIFYDKSQIIDNKKMGFPTYMTSYNLTTNIRNTNEIHNMSKRYYTGTAPRESGLSGAMPIFSELTNPSELTKRLDSILQDLQKESISLKSIAILHPDPLPVKLTNGEKLGSFVVRNLDTYTEKNNEILVDSILRFKGLERTIVILTGLESIVNPSNYQLSQIYVGLTRPKQRLYVVGSQKVIDTLRK